MITYEWIVEELEGPEQDIRDVTHFDTLAPAMRLATALHNEGKSVAVGLVRDVWNDIDENLDDRQWAYSEDGAMPVKFDGGAAIPKRFLAEVAKETKR